MENNFIQNQELQQALKQYGLVKEDNSFNEKLSAEDVRNFLKGHIIIADNKNTRVSFQIINNKLDVKAYQRDKNIETIIQQSKNQIQYSNIKNIFNPDKGLEIQKKAFVYDEKLNKTTEYDFVKDTYELSKIIAERKDAVESNRYKTELLKLKDFLQDKMDKFPEIAKEISNDMNIVSKTINTIDDLTPNEKQAQQQEKTNVQLNVNDPDLYQDANHEREEEWEQNQEQERKRGFRR